jgi:hypothetical protein
VSPAIGARAEARAAASSGRAASAPEFAQLDYKQLKRNVNVQDAGLHRDV